MYFPVTCDSDKKGKNPWAGTVCIHTIVYLKIILYIHRNAHITMSNSNPYVPAFPLSVLYVW